MRRFVIAAIAAAALGPAAGAQPVPVMPQPVPPPPLPPLPAVLEPNVYVPPGAPPGPAIPFHKSGGVVVGAYGFYPYDTGNWLLGGNGGLTRQSGSFTMVYPSVLSGAASGPSADCRHPLFGHPLFRR
ncbi:MAG: hypothetical protein J0I06_17915 [Planctomycetes bacterium]|nr:hypothetical protein [Planctomycetota bacterium]